MNQNVRKLIYIAVAVVAVGLIASVFILGLQSRGKTATIEVQSAVPDDINVTIDGNKVASTGKVSVEPGEHTLVAKRKGFEDQTHKVSVGALETKTVRLLLTPNGPEGSEWARAHPTQFLEYEGRAGQIQEQTSVNLTQKYPLIAHLPEVRSSWRVDYGRSVAHPNDPNALAITITYGGDIDKQNALDWIKSEGFNPNDYEIIYKIPPSDAGG